MPRIFELKKQRQKLVDKARAEYDRMSTPEEGKEFRALSTEDKAQVDAILADVTSLDELIDRLEAIEGLGNPSEDSVEGEEEMNSAECDVVKNSKRKTQPYRIDGRELNSLDPMERARAIYSSKEYRKAFNGWARHGQLILPAEFRDMTLGTSSAGGYLVTPTQISDDITMALNNLVFLRSLATIETVTTAQSLGVRQLTTQPSDAAWTSEIGSISADSTMAFGLRSLTPNLLTKLINISIRLLEATPDAEPLINDRLAYKFAVAEENAFMNGTGSSQPLGLFTASASGIPTSQDYVVTASSSTTIAADNIISAKYQLKQQYLAEKSVRWIFHRVFVNQLRLLKDSQNRYLWFDGAGYSSMDKPAPPTFDGIPVAISEYAPSAATAGSYCGLLGALKYDRVAQVRDMQIQRLLELYAGTSEVGFLARRWFDGSPVLAEAFVRLQIHA